MNAFERPRTEPNPGDDVIACEHLANDVEGLGEIKFRYDNPPAKVLTGTGQYLRANWSACCQSCLAEGGGDADKIRFVGTIRWPSEEERKARRDEKRKAEEAEANQSRQEDQERQRIEGERKEAADRLRKEAGSRGPKPMKNAGKGEPFEEQNQTTDWPPKEEFWKNKIEATDRPNENPKAEFGQEVVPPPPGFPLADDVTDPRRLEEQRYVMSQGGGALPPIEESPPKSPEEFMGDNPPPVQVTDHEAESGAGFQENNPNQPGPGEAAEDLGVEPKKKGKKK